MLIFYDGYWDICRNPLEAGQKFNMNVLVDASKEDSRNPLEAGQKFNVLPE